MYNWRITVNKCKYVWWLPLSCIFLSFIHIHMLHTFSYSTYGIRYTQTTQHRFDGYKTSYYWQLGNAIEGTRQWQFTHEDTDIFWLTGFFGVTVPVFVPPDKWIDYSQSSFPPWTSWNDTDSSDRFASFERRPCRAPKKFARNLKHPRSRSARSSYDRPPGQNQWMWEWFLQSIRVCPWVRKIRRRSDIATFAGDRSKLGRRASDASGAGARNFECRGTQWKCCVLDMRYCMCRCSGKAAV